MTNKLSLNPELIRKFQHKVNEHSFIREKYLNSDQKNKWNIICSAMDWITVVVEGIPFINLNHHNDNVQSLNLMQYIITIDILTESIIQLYRVFWDKDFYPLQTDNQIFRNFSLSDDKYFKHVRAVFGTHPVNLDSLDGIKAQRNERIYASWSSGRLVNDDFVVFLYSNNPHNDKAVQFGIKINDINLYADKRYNLLTELISFVEKEIKEHLNNCRDKEIPTLENPIEQLNILRVENKNRYGSVEGYFWEIEKIQRLLQVKLSSNAVEPTIIDEYRSILVALITDIKSNLQDMKDDDINFYKAFYPAIATRYEFTKVYEYLDGSSKNPIGNACFNALIERGILPEYLFECDNNDEKLFVLNAILYHADKLNEWNQFENN